MITHDNHDNHGDENTHTHDILHCTAHKNNITMVMKTHIHTIYYTVQLIRII